LPLRRSSIVTWHRVDATSTRSKRRYNGYTLPVSAVLKAGRHTEYGIRYAHAVFSHPPPPPPCRAVPGVCSNLDSRYLKQRHFIYSQPCISSFLLPINDLQICYHNQCPTPLTPAFLSPLLPRKNRAHSLQSRPTTRKTHTSPTPHQASSQPLGLSLHSWKCISTRDVDFSVNGC